MMRTCITLLFLLASLPLCRAEQVEVARAEALARRFFLQGSALRSTNDLGLQLVWCGQEGKLRASTEAPAFYVYNRTDAPGFIIIAGDDAVVPILGYSYDHTFRADSMPPNLSSWMNSYEDLILTLREKGTEASPSVRSAWERLSVAEPQKLLATAEWSQGVPYNQQCPLIGGQRAATGCVATAAAILLKYYEWPATVEPQEIHYTTSRGLEVSASLGGSYDWSLMPDKEPDGGFTDEQAAEIARLMFHCGAVCEMDYGLYESSASGITSAGRLIETFDLLPSASTRYKSGYSAEEWNAMLRAELDLDRPLFYGGEDYNSAAHQFIIDGYDNQDRFHVNWGWGGSSNGFFSLELGGSAESEYSFNQACTFRLIPNREGSTAIDNTLQYIQHYEGLHFFNGLTTQSVIFRPNRPIPLDLGGIWNANPFTFNGSLLIALTDKEGNIKEELWDTTLSDLQSSYYTFYNDPITVTITEEICPGDRLRAFSRGEGDTEWRWIRGGYARFDPLLKLSDEILLMPDESATAVESIQSAADDIAILPAGEGRWCISASSPIERILWYSLSGQMLESTAGDGTTRMEVGRPAAGRLILRIVCREGSRSAIL